jgi:hypothetical protein
MTIGARQKAKVLAAWALIGPMIGWTSLGIWTVMYFYLGDGAEKYSNPFELFQPYLYFWAVLLGFIPAALCGAYFLWVSPKFRRDINVVIHMAAVGALMSTLLLGWLFGDRGYEPVLLLPAAMGLVGATAMTLISRKAWPPPT